MLRLSAIITDKKSVISAVGNAGYLNGKSLSESFISIIENKSSFIINYKDGAPIKKITETEDESEFISQIIVPVLDNENTAIGSVVILGENKNAELSLKELDLANLASKILTADVD